MFLTGKFIEKMEPQTGESSNGKWKKQDFIIETFDQYPKKICITNWNDKIDMNSLEEEMPIKVSFDIESRNYNEKWYTNLKVWRIEKLDEANPGFEDLDKNKMDFTAKNISEEEAENEDLPF